MITAGTFTTLLAAGFGIHLASSVWWYLIAVALLTVFAFLIYRYTLPPVGRLRRWLLFLLRTLALLLLVLMLFEPVFSLRINHTQKPSVAVLIDASASVSGSDSSRASAVITLPEWLTKFRTRLPHDLDWRFFSFSDSIQRVAPDSLAAISFSGVGTDIADAVQGVMKSSRDQHLAAVVLISDGAYNVGENPVRVASNLATPIYTVGVGDTAPQRDAAITDVLSNEVAYAGHAVPVTARVHGRFLSGKQTAVRLLSASGAELQRRTIRFADDNAELTVDFSFVPEHAGDQRVTVMLDTLAGESAVSDNRRSIVVHVLEGKARVLLIAGGPSPDLTVLRQTLEEDTSLSVNTFVESLGGSYLVDRRGITDSLLASTNLVVVLDYPTSASVDSTLKRIHTAVTQESVPFFFFAGPRVSASKFRILTEGLPLGSMKPVLGEDRVTVRETSLNILASGSSPMLQDWSSLSPVIGAPGNFEVSSAAQVAAEFSRESLGLPEDEPALIYWRMGSRHGAAFLCWGLYRWKFNNQPDGVPFFDRLIPRLVSWLLAPAEEQRVRFRTSKKLYSGGEQVRITAEVYDPNLEPAHNATINLRIFAGQRSEVVAMGNRGNGRYEGTFTPWANGDYQFAGVALQDNDTLGTDAGMFAVEPYNIELVDRRARFDVLRAMSDVSGGVFAPLASADSLMEKLSFPTHTVETHRDFPLWNRAGVMWLIIGFLALEWIIRKRSGML